MAELDLSLSDALTDSVPQPSPESLVERDFVAQLEAETFDDQVGETVGKTDYIPLLDNDDTSRPGCKQTAGGQTTASRPEPQGEVWPQSLDPQQASATDFLSGFSQPSGMGANVEVANAPFTPSAERIMGLAEPQHPSPPEGSDAPKEHSPMLPEPQAPRSPLDLSAGALGDCWQNQTGCLSTDLPFTQSVSTVISRHAGQLAASPDDPPDGWFSRESSAYAAGDERDGDGSDRKQKKKKKRRQKDEGSYEQLESRGHPEVQAQEENTPPTEEFYNRIGPRRERGEGGWEEQLGKSGGRGKRGKSRKKLPEEWGVMAEPFVPASAVNSQITEEVMVDLGSSAQANLEASFDDRVTSESSWKKESFLEEGMFPSPLSKDLFSPTIATINPLVLNSELKATAAPFTMPSTIDGAKHISFPVPAQPSDPFDFLMDTEHTSLDNNNQSLLPPFSPENEAIGCDMVDSGMSDNTSLLQESSIQGMPEGDTSSFSPASQASPGLTTEAKVLASAPPLSPSDASWLLNDSNMGGNSELFDFSDMSTSSHPVTLGLSFDAPSPAPLRSPKTTAQEFHPKEDKDARPAPKQSKKSRSSSSSSVKSLTPPGAKKSSAQASPVISPSSPPSVSPLGPPGSGLNPAAKPFFPSFADSMEEPAVVPPVTPSIEVKSDMKERAEKEEKLEENVKMVDMFDPLGKSEQKGVTVDFTSSPTAVKMEKEEKTEKDKPNETQNEKEAEKVKEKEKEAEKLKETEKQAEKLEGKKEIATEKVEPVQQKTEKEDTVKKMDESQDKSLKTEQVDKIEKEESMVMEKVESKAIENVVKVDKTEKSKVEEKAEVKEPMPVKPETTFHKLENENETEAETKTTVQVEETKNDNAKETEKEAEMEKPAKKTAEKSDKKEKQGDEKTVEKKDEKKDKAAKADGEKAKKAKPATNGSSAAPSKDADKKTKPVTGATKLGAATKTRLSTTAAGGSSTAPTKRPTPSTTTTTDKKPTTPRAPTTARATTTAKASTTAKAPSTAASGPKRPSTTTTTSRPASSSTATIRDVKAKTTAERRPLVPKASTATSNQTGSTAATKNGTATTAASKTAASVHMTSSSRHITTTAAKKPLASKTDSKPGEEKKVSTLKTSAADLTKPRTTTLGAVRSSVTTTAASRTRTTVAKPATPSSTTGTVPEKKKPLVPRIPRTASSATTTTTTTTSSRTTTRPSTAPAPDIRNARSKIGSTDNMKHQPGGGKVPSASQNRGPSSKETTQGKVQILSKKVDLSKVTSKCGSKDNIKHKPGGGDVKIESHKVSFREKAQSKVGSMDNVSHLPGGGNIKAEGAQETTEGNGTPLSGTTAPATGSEPGQAESPSAQENGLKEGPPCDSEGLRETQALDSLIPETSI